MGKTNIHAMQRRMHHGFEPSKEFPMEEKKRQQKRQILAKKPFEKPSVDWGHGPGSLRINQLVCTPIVDLLDGVRSFPL
jgi:hypothetical protein